MIKLSESPRASPNAVVRQNVVRDELGEICTHLSLTREPARSSGVSFSSAQLLRKVGPCWDRKHAVIYRGLFRQVEDDDGHVLRRGIRTAVCEKTFVICTENPYRSHFELIQPRTSIPLEKAQPFPCAHGALTRHPKETKGEDYRVTAEARVCGLNNGSKGGCC